MQSKREVNRDKEGSQSSITQVEDIKEAVGRNMWSIRNYKGGISGDNLLLSKAVYGTQRALTIVFSASLSCIDNKPEFRQRVPSIRPSIEWKRCVFRPLSGRDVAIEVTRKYCCHSFIDSVLRISFQGKVLFHRFWVT